MLPADSFVPKTNQTDKYPDDWGVIKMKKNFCGKTDVGLKRDNNQDCFLIRELGENIILMVVCDGMGGAAGGSEASTVAAEVFAEYVCGNFENTECRSKLLLDAQIKANDAVCDKAQTVSGLDGMGTTIVAALYDGEKYTCLWVGDSRIYALTKGVIKQISHDHSFVQALVDSGNITSEEAKNHPNRNIITKAIGTSRNIEGDVCEFPDSELDGILLCSDGLCGYVEEDRICDICNNENDAEKCVEKLVAAANDVGGTDNITVIVHKKR